MSSDIKNCISSRWGDKGVIIEGDFKQLEVFVLAWLSGDQQLYDDLRAGLDMHCVNASFLYGKSVDFIKDQIDKGSKEWKGKRKIAKGPGFLK